jgi:hypothetical protein
MQPVSLGRCELTSLKSRNEQPAFWINLFNVLVIHGVIELVGYTYFVPDGTGSGVGQTYWEIIPIYLRPIMQLSHFMESFKNRFALFIINHWFLN